MNEVLTQEQFLLDQSVKYINDEWEKGLDSWCNIGEYVLINFFDNNIEKANSKAWNKEHSFVKLCEHPELKMSDRSLSHCVRLVVQDNVYLTSKALSMLPKAHKILLLPVLDNDKIEAAQEITGLSWRDARDWIKQKYSKPTNWLKVDDVWNFPECEAGYGTEGYAGGIPAQIVKNAYHQEQFALSHNPKTTTSLKRFPSLVCARPVDGG